jgi:UDP-N-acetylglucosamine 2-epimerase
LLPEIEDLVSSDKYDWVIKFHPKMAKEVVMQYQALANKFDTLSIYAQADLMSVIRQCDLVLSDTSSAISESLLQRKPVVTYNNAKPDEHILDFHVASELGSKIAEVFENADKHAENFDRFAAEYHPSNDGKASYRVIEASIQCIEHGLNATKKKPANLFRNFKLRRQENHWPWTKLS